MTFVDPRPKRYTPMSVRRHQVAQLVAQGLLNKQIAAELRISMGQVKRIIGRIAIAWDLDRDKDIRVLIALRYRETFSS